MSKRILNLLILTASSTFALNLYAVAPGFYLGLMAGPAANGSSTQLASIQGGIGTVGVKPKRNQFGTRLFLGYKFSSYIGIESGFTYFSSINYSPVKNVDTCTGTSIQVNTFDIVGKGSIPLGTSFDVFGKAGLAVNYFSIPAAMNPGPSGDCGNKDRQLTYKPTFGLGGSYDIDQNWVADLSWTRVMVGSVVNTMDLIALGISYHFVDKYCGQFLCDD